MPSSVCCSAVGTFPPIGHQHVIGGKPQSHWSTYTPPSCIRHTLWPLCTIGFTSHDHLEILGNFLAFFLSPSYYFSFFYCFCFQNFVLVFSFSLYSPSTVFPLFLGHLMLFSLPYTSHLFKHRFLPPIGPSTSTFTAYLHFRVDTLFYLFYRWLC